MEQIN